MKNTADLTLIKSVALFMLLTTGDLIAAEKENNDRNPIGCNDVGYEFNLVTLDLLPTQLGANQSLYFIYNSTPQKIILYQMRSEDSSRSMYLNHAIEANQWGVFSTSEKKVKYICTVADNKSSYGKIVDCATSLRVCQYSNVKYGMNNRGNYWLVNSNSKNGAVREVVRYGIIPGV